MILLAFVVVAAVTAADPKIAIVDVEVPDLMMGLGAQVTRALVDQAKAQHLNLMTPEALRAKMDPRHYEALKKCVGKVACVAQELEGLGIARALVGQLNRDEKNYLLKLWLIDVPGLKVLADVDRAILIAARRFQRDLDQAVPPLLRGEREARGTLVVRVTPADATISVNDAFAGVSPVSLSLKPGKYEVKAERKKYLPVTRLVAVEANQESAMELKLLLAPGEIADDQFIPALAAKADGSSSGGVSPLTWVLGGATAAAGGVALTFGLLARSQERSLRDGFDAETNTYQGTRTQALEQNRNAAVANVMLAVTGAGLIGTVISAIVDASHQPVRVTAFVTPSTATVSVGGSF